LGNMFPFLHYALMYVDITQENSFRLRRNMLLRRKCAGPYKDAGRGEETFVRGTFCAILCQCHVKLYHGKTHIHFFSSDLRMCSRTDLVKLPYLNF
jgi:hypothetical protein